MNQLFGIEPRDEPHYRSLIRRERALAQNDFQNEEYRQGVRAVMIVAKPDAWTPGKCIGLIQDVAFPYSFELSIAGYPGFGVLDKLRGRIGLDESDPLFGGEETNAEFTFNRTDTNEQIVEALPKFWRERVRLTGGRIYTGTTTTTDADGVITSTDNYTNVGRWFMAFDYEPTTFAVAETEEPTDAELLSLVGVDNEGNLNAAPTDDNGFSTNRDSRVTFRSRKVPFVCADLVSDIVSLVDTSIPSPIAAGALAYAANVPGLGLSIISVEPRVYQELSGAFDTPYEAPE